MNMTSYNLSYDFTATLVGQGRTFNDKGNGQTIKLTLNSKANNAGGRSDEFVVQLQAQVQRMWFTVKTAAFPRNGKKTVEFKDLAGTAYRLRFEKSTDDVRVTGTGVMSN